MERWNDGILMLKDASVLDSLPNWTSKRSQYPFFPSKLEAKIHHPNVSPFQLGRRSWAINFPRHRWICITLPGVFSNRSLAAVREASLKHRYNIFRGNLFLDIVCRWKYIPPAFSQCFNNNIDMFSDLDRCSEKNNVYYNPQQAARK